jgi:hypothetical protein
MPPCSEELKALEYGLVSVKKYKRKIDNYKPKAIENCK